MNLTYTQIYFMIAMGTVMLLVAFKEKIVSMFEKSIDPREHFELRLMARVWGLLAIVLGIAWPFLLWIIGEAAVHAFFSKNTNNEETK
jgi:hypothetical protein